MGLEGRGWLKVGGIAAASAAASGVVAVKVVLRPGLLPPWGSMTLRGAVVGFALVLVLALVGVALTSSWQRQSVLKLLALSLALQAGVHLYLGRSLDRWAQKQTIGALRNVMTAIESYAMDHEVLPTATSHADLEVQLVPTYIKAIPAKDGWGNAFLVEAGPTRYRIASLGADGDRDVPSLDAYVEGSFDTFDGDIVYGDGTIVRWPEGGGGC